MREARPQGVRQFFAIANQHMRWELNDVARRLDKQAPQVEVRESFVAAPDESNVSRLSPDAVRILEAIDKLPEEEREAFDLVRIQVMTQPEAAEVLGVGVRTVQRRLNRALMLLADALSELRADAGTGLLRRARAAGGSPPALAASQGSRVAARSALSAIGPDRQHAR
jgi:RNA polymerase sigma factor (sigma-70 family)